MFDEEIHKAENEVIKTLENLAPIMGYAMINAMSNDLNANENDKRLING